jgi:hypothetical protein
MVKVCNKYSQVVAAIWQWLVVAWTSASVMVAHPNAVLLKFVTNEDRHVVRKGIVGTKLGLDEDLMPTQQVHKSEIWLLFKEAKATGKCAFWRAIKFFVDGTQICLPSSV